MRRVAAAIVMSIVGTGVFLALRRALGTLIDSPWLLAGCVAGTIVSTLLFYDGRGLGFRNNLRPAVRIVFATFAVIASGHAVSQRYQRGVKIDFEPIGSFSGPCWRRAGGSSLERR